MPSFSTLYPGTGSSEVRSRGHRSYHFPDYRAIAKTPRLGRIASWTIVSGATPGQIDNQVLRHIRWFFGDYYRNL